MALPLRKLSSPAPDRARLARLADELEEASPQEILARAFDEFTDGISIATGFGAEGMALIDMAVRIDPAVDVFFIDTGFLFPETYELRRRVEEKYKITIRAFKPQLTPHAQERLFGPALWERNADLCCQIRKLEPLEDALEGLVAWVTAIRRDQTVARASAQAIEWDERWGLAKINPLIRWSKREVWDYLKSNDVPFNPLHLRGYPSIGCTHCTRAVREGEDDRAGRWSGREKTECGLHAETTASKLWIAPVKI
ncbi:MAG: phosphoadenylyl-sulfate reductase [Acidobacteriota bacterium]